MVKVAKTGWGVLHRIQVYLYEDEVNALKKYIKELEKKYNRKITVSGFVRALILLEIQRGYLIEKIAEILEELDNLVNGKKARQLLKKLKNIIFSRRGPSLFEFHLR